MKVTYDTQADTLRIVLSDAAIEESDEERLGIILDYDRDGNVVGLEILGASKLIADSHQNPYRMVSTSLKSAKLDDLVLSQKITTRKVIRPQIVENIHDPQKGVKVTLAHQRKGPNDQWEDIPTEPLSKLKKGEEYQLSLDTSETFELFRRLNEFFAVLAQHGVTMGNTTLVVGQEDEIIRTKPYRVRVIKSLISQGHSSEFWQALAQEEPDLVTKLSYARVQSERTKALSEFRNHLVVLDWHEPHWKRFFQDNPWIFGYGLRYEFLGLMDDEVTVNGQDYTGVGASRVDFMTRTEGDISFTVPVEIKRPDTSLLGRTQYRNNVWEISDELSGGVSQIQSYCHKWELQGARTDENRERLESGGTYTIRPKGILVIGRLSELVHDLSRRTTFELYRANTINPEIITYDQLYERAKHIAENTANGNV